MNDSKGIDDNFLTNINNYNTEFNNNADSIETLKKVLNLHKKLFSKPISRKIHQNLTIPYWILINEMTFGEAISCLKNLKKDINEKIYINLTKEFTGKSLVYPKNIKMIQDFSRILDYISEFRNVLAHNQPIFNYNYENNSLCGFPNFEFIEPKMPLPKLNDQKIKNLNLSDFIIKRKYQHNKNKFLIKTCSYFFGNDY